MKIKIYKNISDIGIQEWNQHVAKRFFLSYNYLHTLELACTQLEYRYVLCYDKGEFQGLCYFQIIPFSGNNLHQYIPSSNRIIKFAFENILSQINTELIVLGNVVFTCENGVLISPNATVEPDKIVYESITKVHKTLKRKAMASMISENINSVSTSIFCNKKYHEFRVEDRMEIDLSKFTSFESYQDSIQSKYRVRLNKIYKLNQHVKEIDITQENFNQYRDEIENLFYQVLNHSKFKLTTISVNYFYEFIQHISRFKIKGYLNGNKLVGFISYFELDSIIEVHYVGLDYQYNHQNKIYNYILYRILESSFDLQAKKICYGRTAQELKSTLGALPYSISSSLKLNNRFLNLLTPFFLNRMIPSEWTPRNPFKNQ